MYSHGPVTELGGAGFAPKSVEAARLRTARHDANNIQQTKPRRQMCHKREPTEGADSTNHAVVLPLLVNKSYNKRDVTHTRRGAPPCPFGLR